MELEMSIIWLGHEINILLIHWVSVWEVLRLHLEITVYSYKLAAKVYCNSWTLTGLQAMVYKLIYYLPQIWHYRSTSFFSSLWDVDFYTACLHHLHWELMIFLIAWWSLKVLQLKCGDQHLKVTLSWDKRINFIFPILRHFKRGLEHTIITIKRCA